MKLQVLLFVIAMAGIASPGQNEDLLARWSFDEASGSTVLDSATSTRDTIAGFHKFVPGVSGNALQFDGYTTQIVRPYRKAPSPTAGFTVESWVALDAYPWNWIPLIDHERDNQAGYLFGIDAYGHIGLHAAVGGSWQVLTSTARVPLKRWTHVAGTFDPDQGLALYMDGKLAGEMAVRGKLVLPERTDLMVGRVREAMMPVPSGLIHPKDPVFYSLEGELDELSIHNRALSAPEIAAEFASIRARPRAFFAVGGAAGRPRRTGAVRSFLCFAQLLGHVGPDATHRPRHGCRGALRSFAGPPGFLAGQ